MSKAYSNKALPSGTVLREWRLEEVLGVGGFGIVYKGRGIYFDELVAIKEYFPSAISERQEGDTVVPIDSDAEEVHALGLKKFVEEAKLLWNLSTPSRHPNIVSVRSLFEIHGTAYMVMDFEDGVSLSKLLKEGKRFNEASLMALLRPISEGLDRAHRVGVLHRDIKPPNILVNEDGRPVLIDFGSARFDTAEATSTKVTFHTPPYAAIEQYVKTYEQGPWTDIYALGVVLYECVTGEKPPEVLERMHGGLGKPLAEQEWPGFSRSFLMAVDAAMTIRPDERPGSISEWLALFDRTEDELPPPPPAEPFDEDATQIAAFASSPQDIKPVAPPAPGFGTRATIHTPVPERTSQAEFKRAGEDTRGEQTPTPPSAPEPKPDSEPAASAPAQEPAASKPVTPAPKPAKADTKAKAKKPSPASDKKGSNRSLVLAGAGGLAAVLLGGAWFAFSGGSSGGKVDQELAEITEPVPDAAAMQDEIAQAASERGYAPLVLALAKDAEEAGMPARATRDLAAAGARMETLQSDMAKLSGQPAAFKQKETELAELTNSALAEFVGAVAADGEDKSRRIARDLPWANPRRAGSANGEDSKKQRIAASLGRSYGSIRTAQAGIAEAKDPTEAIALARQALTASRSFSLALNQAYRAGPSNADKAEQLAQAGSPAQTPEASETTAAPVEQPAQAGPAGGVSAATRQEFDSVASSAKDIAKQVIRLGERARPGSNASDKEKEDYRVRQQNAQTAKGYESYLDTLSRSMIATKTDSEARKSVGKAKQTLSYLSTLLANSKAAMP